MRNLSTFSLFTIFLLIIASIILLPHLFIWSLNELFDQTIAHDSMNWLAAFVLTVFFFGGSSTTHKS